MEQIHCATCNEPKWHQTVSFYNELIHNGIKCLTCGKVVKHFNVIQLKPMIADVDGPKRRLA
jgi:hypothetical protein